MALYCSTDSLELYLGRDLTDGEDDAAAGACAAATAYIDGYTGKSWQGTTITGELHEVTQESSYGRYIVRLDHPPVTSITSATSRALIVGETPTALVAGTDYELIDARAGHVLVNLVRGSVFTVTYVVGSVVPADIALAANIIAAAYAVTAQSISSEGRGIQKLKAGSAEITYDPIDASAEIPKAAYDLLAAYKPAFAFA